MVAFPFQLKLSYVDKWVEHAWFRSLAVTLFRVVVLVGGTLLALAVDHVEQWPGGWAGDAFAAVDRKGGFIWACAHNCIRVS